ncbi:ABC transporter permease [Nocardioides sp. CFH 31398]|uniref:ABC transporter permease n=1 Tax=Nocardioides sp. CFH 31398 TaxID=2919579 RepID=UPI001F06DA94|nr:ABC transporter permease [Nocardioides sp. CFH 31398]MCH1867268.1 ABC transporter permease [Nocardioides sp. CFH 31398]
MLTTPVARTALRLARVVSLLVAVVVGSFWLMAASPVDPVQAYVGADVAAIGPEQREQIAERWGLDDPPLERFAAWAGNVLTGDLGESQIFGEPVAVVLADRAAASLALMATAWVLSGVLGFALGVLAGVRAGTVVDRVLSWWAYLLASAPTFWVGLLLLYLFSVSLGWTPVGGAVPSGTLPGEATVGERLHHLLLPAATLSLVGVSPVLLHTRQAVVEAMASDHVAFARAQGERGWGLVLHRVLRNAAGPAVVLQFATIGELFGGSLLAEQVFTYPGLGEATTQAALRQDVPLLLGIAMVTALVVLVGNAVGRVLGRVVDPRAAVLAA